MTSEFQEIKYAIEDRVLTITLNRPEKLNAFTAVMQGELIEAFQTADDDDEIRVIIVTGEGRGFCAGADLGKGAKTFDRSARKTSEDGEHHRDGGGRVTLKIFDLKKPVIAAINGPAVGVGITMTLPMDIRIASETARFGFVFARRGIVPEACSSWFLPRIVGISQATEWVFSGRVFDAQEALRGRLVSQVVAPEALLPTARTIAKEIVDNTSAVSIALCRQMLWKMLVADHPMEAHKVDSRGIVGMGGTPDSEEGVTSFLEKRLPNFSMKPSTDMPEFFPWWEDRPFS